MSLTRFALVASAALLSLVLGGCGGDSTPSGNPPAPGATTGGEVPIDIEEELLTRLDAEQPPEWFPRLPLPTDLTGITAQQGGTGNYDLMGTLADVTDRDGAVSAYAAVLADQGWTIQPLGQGAGANPGNTEGFEAERDGARVEFALTGRADSTLFTVLMSLTGFDMLRSPLAAK